MWDLFIEKRADVLRLLLEHINISLMAIWISIIIAIPLGILLTRVRKLDKIVMEIASIFQTIPSLALMGFMVPLMGIGVKPTIVVLVLYALFPILLNTFTGIVNVDPSLKESGKGMGMNDLQVLYYVEIPQALPVILAGIKTAAVLVIGVATAATLIGAGGLGDLIFTGIQTVNSQLILLGTIPVAFLAISFNYIIRYLEYNYSIKSKLTYSGANKRIIAFAFISLMFLLVPLLKFENNNDTLIIGGKGYTEQHILAEMLGIYIEENSEIDVQVKSGMGTNVLANGLKSGNIDVYVEYTGTAYYNLLNKDEELSNDEIVEVIRDEYGKLGLKWYDPLGYNNTYAIVARKTDIQNSGWETISDIRSVEHNKSIASDLELFERPEWDNFVEKYNFDFQERIAMDPSLMYNAIANNEVDFIVGYTTDGRIGAYDLEVIEDDLGAFPSYYACVNARVDILEKYPELDQLLLEFNNILTEEKMSELNGAVDIEKQNIKQVARDFLIEEGLIES